MKKFTLMFLIVVLFTFSGALAQDTTANKAVENLFQLSLDDFLNVVITPSKLPQMKGTVTQKVDIITQANLETTVLGNRNLCEAIACLPGASVSVLSRNDANWGTYGGIGPKYSTYMLQGVPIDAFVDPMSLDLNAFERIEVQRGPASVIYPNYLSQDFAGNQSPLAGTVNLILKEKVSKQKTIIKPSLGSYNTLNGQVFHENKHKGLNYFIGSNFETADYTNYGIDGSWLNMNKNPEYQKTKIYGGLTYFTDKSEKQKITLFCHKTWHNGNTGRTYKGYNYEYGTINLGYEININSIFSLQSHLGIRSYNRSWQESVLGVVDTLKSSNGVDQLIIPFDISLSWLQGESASLSVGADYQRAHYSTWNDPLSGYRLFGNKSTAMQSGFYIQEEWRPFKKWTLRAGIRYTFIQNNIDLVNGGSADVKNPSWDNMLWSAGTRYNISDQISVFFNGGSSFSTPGLKSVAGTILLSDLGVEGRNGQLPNPDLKPEKGLGFDAGIDLVLQQQLNLSIRGFYNILQDGIIDNVVSQNPSQTQSINTESTAKGGEIDITHHISSKLSWYLNATYMMSNIENSLNSDQDNVQIPFSPNYIANLGGNVYTDFGLKINVSLNYNDGFYDGISKAGRLWYTPGVVLNSYVSQTVAKNDAFELALFTQFYNITNNKYDMPWQFKNTGFSGMGGLKITFY